MLCCVDKLSFIIIFFNVKRKEKKCGYIVFLLYKNIFLFNSLIWIFKYIKIFLIKWLIL